MYKHFANDTVVVRSGGDIATGVIQKLWRCGFRVAVLEMPSPLTIRRSVALSTAVRKGSWTVEDISAVLAHDASACEPIWESGAIPVLVDPGMESLKTLRPVVLIDAIIAKRNTGMHASLAPITIGLGPGFSAPEDVDCVIETMRGHDLGRLITKGCALPNTGVPGVIGGKSADRVVHAPSSGIVRHAKQLGDRVKRGEIIFYIDSSPVVSPLDGTLRGLIEEGTRVREGLKSADVDPRPAGQVNWTDISDKARAIGGAVIEACFMLASERRVFLNTNRASKHNFQFENLSQAN